MYEARYIGSGKFRVTDSKTANETIVEHHIVHRHQNYRCYCGKDRGDNSIGPRCDHVRAVLRWEDHGRFYGFK